MKNKQLFEKTVGILVNAYRNDTLMRGFYTACAVGNIVAYNCGINDINSIAEWHNKALDKPSSGWGSVFLTVNKQRVIPKNYKGAAKFQIDSTGYSWQELAKIEYAFETAPKGTSGDEWMFNGLIAVYDVLCEIHEVNKEEVKKGELVFVK